MAIAGPRALLAPVLARVHRPESRGSRALAGGHDRLRARRPRHPAVATPPVMALASGGLFLGGGVLALVGSSGGASHGMELVPLRAVSAAAIATGALLLATRHRLPRWFYHLTVFLGTVLISVTVTLTGSPSTAVAYAALYGFVAIDCFFFFSWLPALGQLGAAVVGAVLAFDTVGVPRADQVVSLGATVLVAVVVGWLVRQADAAEIDGLTGLPNRRGFDHALHEAVTRAARDDRPLALAFVDLHHVEQVSDRDGRTRGDRLLELTTHSWRTRLAPGVVLARYSGSEFALLLPGHTADGAAAVVGGLRDGLRAPLACSAGIAARLPGDSAQALVERADGARYEARRGGRDHVADGSRPGPRASDLRRAIVQDELFLTFQPVIELGTDDLVGVEALVRWRHPTRGLLTPDQFVPDAEGGDLIHDLGRWVTGHACRQAVRWRDRYGFAANIAINVAGPELGSPGYADRVLALLADAGQPPERVVLEVTETTMDADSAAVVATLQDLRAHGVKIAIDDFGTGYSSLNRLDRLPFDILKIDRSFVEPLAEPGADTTVLTAVVALAAALGVDVVAEGVETAGQDAIIRALGCAFAQGYYYGRPREAVDDAVPCRTVPGGSAV